MRVAIYNQMFGLNGKSFWKNVVGHWAVHYQSDPEKVWKRSDISETIETISKSKADIIGINEVLEGQEEEIRSLLEKQGYLSYFAEGHKTKSGKYVKIALASRFDNHKVFSKEFNNLYPKSNFPVLDCMGGGGGFIHCNFPKEKFDVINVHLCHEKDKELYERQMNFLGRYLCHLGEEVIVMGDFNKIFKDFHKEGYFWGLNLVSNEIKTCSTTPIMKWFYNKDVDHIFVRGFEKEKVGSLEGMSDHKLIYADLK